MLRRFTWLAVLLLTLSVIAPVVLACDSHDGCCPTQGAPCGQEASEVAVCCVEQPAQAVVTTAARELESLDLRLPHGAVPSLTSQHLRHHSAHGSSARLPRRLPDQQQLYLHTGRLRL
jgi:hypothetical protein